MQQRSASTTAVWLVAIGIGLLFLARGAFQPYIFPLFDQLMSKKLTAQEWIAKCDDLGIADVELSPEKAQQLELLNPKTASLK